MDTGEKVGDPEEVRGAACGDPVHSYLMAMRREHLGDLLVRIRAAFWVHYRISTPDPYPPACRRLRTAFVAWLNDEQRRRAGLRRPLSRVTCRVGMRHAAAVDALLDYEERDARGARTWQKRMLLWALVELDELVKLALKPEHQNVNDMKFLDPLIEARATEMKGELRSRFRDDVEGRKRHKKSIEKRVAAAAARGAVMRQAYMDERARCERSGTRLDGICGRLAKKFGVSTSQFRRHVQPRANSTRT